MAHRKTLNENQIALLRWVEQGCPEGVMEGTAHRVSAAALKSRGLLHVRGKGARWRATLTEAGHAYLAAAEQPDAPRPRQANESVTERLVEEVIASGGVRRYPNKHYWEKDKVDYRLRAQIAQKWGKVPDGKALAVREISQEEIEISLVAAPEIALAPVPVPERVAKYHPVVRAFQERKQRHEVSRALLPRAMRVLEGVVREADARGWRTEIAPDAPKGGYGRSEWSGTKQGHLVVVGEGQAVAIRVFELGLPTRSGWEHKNRRWISGPRGGEYRLPPLSEYEARATGKLALEIVSGYSSRRTRWADTQRARVEDQLSELFAEVELRAAEERERELARQREAEEAERQWEQAMVLARERFVTARRAEALRNQAERWQEARLLHAYCEAIEAAHGADPATRAWLDWARAYAATLDPLAEPPRAPELPEQISPEDLRPYMRGFDPYGPPRNYARR